LCFRVGVGVGAGAGIGGVAARRWGSGGRASLGRGARCLSGGGGWGGSWHDNVEVCFLARGLVVCDRIVIKVFLALALQAAGHIGNVGLANFLIIVNLGLFVYASQNTRWRGSACESESESEQHKESGEEGRLVEHFGYLLYGV